MTGRRSRSAIIAAIVATQPWPAVLVELLCENDKDTFECRKSAVDMYLKNAPLVDIEKQAGVRRSDVSRLLSRCMSLHPDGLVYGYRALIPHIRTTPYIRTADVKSNGESGRGGYAGALQSLLKKYPELHEKLVKKILPKREGGKLVERNIKPAALHAFFVKYLKEKGHPESEWPFNTDLQGYRSISSFIKDVREKNYVASIMLSGNSKAIAQLSVGTGIEATLKLENFMDVFEIDTHKTDAIFVIGVRNPNGDLSYVRLKRLCFIAIVERETGAIWWWRIVYKQEISAQDIIQVITEALRAELPKPTTGLLDLKLPEGSGYPGEMFPQLHHALPVSIFFDNALAHQSADVSTELRRLLGSSLCYGAPGKFEIRPVIERLFRDVAAMIQRLPNTTGSEPGKGGDAANIAIEYHIDADAIEEVMHYYCARYNFLPAEGNFFLSPLKRIEQILALGDNSFIPRRPLQEIIPLLTFKKTTQKVKVRGYLKDGVRPFIEIERVRYKSELLSNSPWMIGETLTVMVDEADMRSVDAYLSNGAYLCELVAVGGWSRKRHSRATRKLINKLIKERLITIAHTDCPITVLLEYLNAKAQGLAKSKEKVVVTSKSKQDAGAATDLKRVTMEAGVDVTQLVGSLKIDNKASVKAETPDPTKGYKSIKPARSIKLKKALD
ncbi:hypothetical protein Q1J61_00580 [Pseudomonas putida]|uniref:hypothetical protein n=1 Tax=Pseudomonas putida TaxID=303 RepID=UPI0034D482D8